MARFDALEAFTAWLWQSSWQATVLAGVIFLVQYGCRRRLPPQFVYALWLLLLVKLMLPVAPASRFSMFQFFQFERWAARAESAAPLAYITSSPFSPAPAQNPARVGAPPQKHAIPLTVFLQALWLGGAVLLLARTLFTSARLFSQARAQRPLVDEAMLDLLENCKIEMRVHAPISIVVTGDAQSPALLGYLRPRLLLPAKMITALEPSELRHVFLHELAHLKRMDVPVNWLIAFLQILHWFNPFLWLAFNRKR